MNTSQFDQDKAVAERLAETVAEQLQIFMNTDLVEGVPVTIDNVTLVPLSEVCVGFGGGGGRGDGEGRGDDEKGQAIQCKISGRGQGGAGGGQVKPVAIVAFTESGVQILEIPAANRDIQAREKRSNLINSMLEKLVERLGRGKHSPAEDVANDAGYQC